MGRFGKWLIVASLLPFTAAAAGAQDDIGNRADGLAEALAGGRATLQLRPRYNHIEEGARPLATEGGTMRFLAGWRTAPWLGWRATLEAIHAERLGRKRFNDDPATNATSPYPLLPDPRHTGVNQAHAEGEAGAVRMRLGRQRLRLGNERWVSDNDFRQVPQVFDGAWATTTLGDRAEIGGGHFRRVRSTSGVTAQLRLSVLEAGWNPAAGHALVGYAVFHDQPRPGGFTGFADNSYRVAGVRAEGSWPLRNVEAAYLVEVARQQPHAGGDERIDAAYRRLGAGLAFGAWTLRYDHETKGSNGGRYGLQMPLTDFYAFNGWSLHFFNTPREGLRDGWATARLALDPVILYAEAHRFRSDHRGLDFGREADVGVTWRVHRDAILRLQHARYRPGRDGTGSDVRKTWLTLTYEY
jgi:hypothetical protein